MQMGCISYGKGLSVRLSQATGKHSIKMMKANITKCLLSAP